ncbi:hypothetical protein BOSE62_71544 [Bosea sp. 62]|nr:hypothetical protein BOSE21B_90072 [Bosea sp. 21B]CAD5293675.1 hypothetical protein BOSE46_80180 [Bosea sp. 46]CAD5299463.1 hypothetical protein BOSE7B_60594 [Bosea sp. 7B]VVT62198.1 hypothetical protein BOS5A_30059 [Bosea sp. EC-HK365B]VXB09795.1 hypothetical protein BOSE125_120059 [Bosea sp. 125]VXB44354.1 hypothetical protein BOSE127_120057 [Bosea sp. 127]VXC72552.1 hypothetical protein BOSE29B_80069 [Bosea sp. 29B]VXC93404.1 hypothetical protein BOSE62_71544 [Bosea sp. 62]
MPPRRRHPECAAGTDPAGWSGYVDETIDQLAVNSTKGFAFNMLTL